MSDQGNNKKNEGDESPESWDTPDDAEVIDDDGQDSNELILQARAFSYRGPVPPPEWMERYERIVPGSAKQMMDDAHAESLHRRQNETKEVDATIGNASRGQWMGFAIGMTGILGGLGMAFFGVSLGGGVALTGLAALTAVYVTGNWRATREAAQAAEDSAPVRQEPPDSGN